MPELPEVETVCRGLAPRLAGATVTQATVREPRLRWPVVAADLDNLRGQKLFNLRRRSKYLLFEFASGTLIAHLGMTGSFRFVTANRPLTQFKSTGRITEERGCDIPTSKSTRATISNA